jgi:glutathione S-transferase
MAIELFWGSGSGFSWRVQLALEVKGLPYESRLLQFSKKEHQSPEYLAINPRGKVPCLRDGDLVVAESLAILAYLDRKYPDPPLFGRTPAQTGAIWQEVQQCALYFDEPVEAFILPLYFGQSEEKAPQIRAALPALHRELTRMESTLATWPWLVTESLSAADLVVYPMVKSVLRAAAKTEAARFQPGLLPFDTVYPGLAAWMTRVESLPGYDRTFPPHWR